VYDYRKTTFYCPNTIVGAFDLRRYVRTEMGSENNNNSRELYIYLRDCTSCRPSLDCLET